MKVCPKCHSKNIQKQITIKSAFGMQENYKCKDCGYEGMIIGEKQDKIKKKRK